MQIVLIITGVLIVVVIITSLAAHNYNAALGWATALMWYVNANFL